MSTTGLIAKKVGMTRMVDPDGQLWAVTLLEVTPQKVTKILTEERDGYHGIQVGYHLKRESLIRKPDLHRLRKVNVQDNFTRFKEFRFEKPVEGMEIGSALQISALEGVTQVDITGVSKGRGFQGATRRWNAKTGRETHGSRFYRRPGSLGMRSTPGRVFKNKHMPGHMGSAKCTIQNLTVMDIDVSNNVIAVRGAVPGHREGYLLVRPTIKGGKKGGK